MQDAWVRISRAGADDVENIGGWLTTIVARVCLNMLRSRNTRPDPHRRGRPGRPRVADDRIVEIDIIGDPDRVNRLAAAVLPS